MRPVSLALTLLACGCHIAKDDPRSLGRFAVEATRSESCGEEVLLASPARHTFWVFLQKTSDHALLWDDGGDRIPLALDPDGAFHTSAIVVVAMDEAGEVVDDPFAPWDPDGPAEEPASGCVIVRLDELAGQLGEDRFDGTLRHTFGAQQGSDCSAWLSAPVPLASELPCTVAFDLEALRVH